MVRSEDRFMDDVESKLNLKSVLKPGSPDRSAVSEMISTSPKLDAKENRANFLNDCGLGELASEFNLDAKSADFASSIINNLLRAEKLDLFLRHLLEVDKFLGPEDKRTLKKILGLEKPPAIKDEIRQKIKAEKSQPSEPSIALKQPKLDKQVLVEYGLNKPDQIPKILDIVETGEGCGVFSIFLEGDCRITKEYIASRIILELRRHQGLEAHIRPNIYFGDIGNSFSESMENLNKKLGEIKTQAEENHCYIFLLECSYKLPKNVKSSFDAFLKHECIQNLQTRKDCCFMFIWTFERNQFTRTRIRELERQITYFPIHKIVLKSFQKLIKKEFEKAGLSNCLNECLEEVNGRRGEFFPTYEYMDNTFVNP